MMLKRPLISAALATSLLLTAGMLNQQAIAGEPGAGKSCVDSNSAAAGHDSCVLVRNGSDETGKGDYAARLCKILGDAGMLDLMGMSYGQCVSRFSQS